MREKRKEENAYRNERNGRERRGREESKEIEKKWNKYRLGEEKKRR